ncbi:hypothetical protein AJ88_47970 [Mesorhizobium amorphae CCBAU 01583]|nr:hypothetical protein AJ88_47970 [Mesorhizobium amorphae CCBAU 01583]
MSRTMSGCCLAKSISDWPIGASAKVRGAESLMRPRTSPEDSRTASARLSTSRTISEARR